MGKGKRQPSRELKWDNWNRGCLSFTKRFRKTPLESKWYREHGRSRGKFQGATEHLKRYSPVFSRRNIPNGNLCSISSKPCLHQFYVFATVSWQMKLICTNDNRDSETKFTSHEFCFPFAQTVNRPACPSSDTNLLVSSWLHHR